MTDNKRDLETRLEELTSQIRTLERRIEQLESGEGRIRAVPDKGPSALSAEKADSTAAEKPWTMGGMTAILSRIATICFLLAVALILRTISDNGLVSMQIGSFLGISYSWLLVATGWFLYRKSHQFAPIFAISGAMLLFSVVLETHAHFGALSSLTAYPMLMIAGTVLATISRWQKVAVPVTLATIGVTVTSLPLDFPNPIIPYLALILLFVNIISYMAMNIPRSWWLRIFAMLTTMAVLTGWTFKLYVVLRRGGQLPDTLYQNWFFPVLMVFVIFYITTSYLSVKRFRPESARLYNSLLPTVPIVWIYLDMWLVISARGAGFAAVGIMGVILSVGLFGIAAYLARKAENKGSGVNLFAFPAAALLALSLPSLLGKFVYAVPLLSGVALGYGILARRWKHDGVRITSYILQASVIIATAASGAFSVKDVSLLAGLMAAAVFSAISYIHFGRSRRFGPIAESGFFAKFDKKDRTAVILFLSSLLGAFIFLRIGIYGLLSGMQGDLANAFTCAQSIIINIGAIALILMAYFRKDYEIRAVAITVTVVGALKVFVVDLLNAQGVPLVLSVLSFGVAAALGSVVLGRWHRREKSGA